MKSFFRCVAAVALIFAGGCSGEKTTDVNWTTMGTIATLRCRAPEIDPRRTAEFLRIGKEVCALAMSRYNAFDPSSTVRRIAHLSDDEVASSDYCLRFAFEMKRLTDGVFDPRWKGKGTLDLGAVAKGYAVDLIAHELARILRPSESVLIDIGGNLRSVGGAWTTAIDDTGKVFVLQSGMSCATSGEKYRGKHIFDPRTGVSAENEVESVTVIAPSAMVADALSTAFFILGPNDGKVEELCRKFSAEVVWIKKGQ